MLTNQTVKLSSALGEIERYVVEDLAEILIVCRREEYVRAARDGRDPVVVGFPRSSLINIPLDVSVSAKHNGQYKSVAEREADPGGRRSR